MENKIVLKIFQSNNCKVCRSKKFQEVVYILYGIDTINVEVYDVNTVDGLVELALHNILPSTSIPLILAVEEE